MHITPWEVRGEVNYDEIIKEFGVELITDDIIERLKKYTNNIHVLLRRKIFFAHREFEDWLDSFEKGIKVILYTGRGPSGYTHLGHLIPWIFTKYLQDVFKADLYFQVTDDEKFLIHPEMSMEDIENFTNDNILDIIAVGFDPERTKIFTNLNYKEIYRIAVRIARHITFSTAKATFGFTESSNIGIIFFPAMQAAPCFLYQILEGKDAHVLIPCAIDQEPYWRISRDVAPKLRFRKPAGIYSKFIPGLGANGKMSTSHPETCIFLKDSPEDVKRKIWNAFTGGQPTLKEQKEKGGNPNICVVYWYLYFYFEDDDKKVEEIYNECIIGKRICGECKELLTKKIIEFLIEHQKRREKAKDMVEKYLLKD
ncbi:MAG: tryptophan--tRNA ligase [Candidatus Methanomethylicota archaeon]|uniref:Tryptophan--tRNA ligase n=1 Tax=Thermoproteota archaeon TaxID=2056631 RepID=A0A523BD71_9CREN|nr:MAG: tryptophan--tRNA ligase [Candidatus Verstraetearchaeota archaeon]TDA38896.1 MAG: tryptophan--tRNA ligase [Candidatus Verstraetearchaeota archaeon]